MAEAPIRHGLDGMRVVMKRCNLLLSLYLLSAFGIGLFLFNIGMVATIRSLTDRRHKHTFTQQPERDQYNLSTGVEPTYQAQIQDMESNNRNYIALNTRGNMTSRLEQFNAFLTVYRARVVNQKNTNRDLNIAQKKKWIIVNGDSYLSELDPFKYLTTVMLPWKTTLENDINTNLLVQRYFPWSAQENVCKLISMKSILPGVYVKVFRKMTCNTDIKRTMLQKSLDYGHVKAIKVERYSDSFYSTPPQNILHLHVLKSHSLVSEKGHVISGGIKLVADYCGRNKHRDVIVKKAEYDSLPVYDEVFTIKHPPGNAVYHGLLEELPRIAPYVEFLRQHENIKIHATSDDRGLHMLNMLGFNKSRIVSGPIRADILYVPRLAFCMLPRVPEIQILSRLYGRYIHDNLPPEPRDRIVLLLRSGTRKFENSNPIKKIVEKAARDYGLRYSEFRDSRLPSINETMLMFRSAVMVVAAHGAGLSNIIFSELQTFVIEVVPNAKITPLCYLHLSHCLGQHWHGLLSPSGRFKVVRVSANLLKSIIERYLTMNKDK